MNRHLRFALLGLASIALTHKIHHIPTVVVTQKVTIHQSSLSIAPIGNPPSMEAEIVSIKVEPSPLPTPLPMQAPIYSYHSPSKFDFCIRFHAQFNPINQALMQQLAASRFGWTGSYWTDLNKLMMSESGYDDQVCNSSSGAGGIGQKIEGIGSYPNHSAIGQINWTLEYISYRYHNPTMAWSFHLAHNWY